VATPTSNKKVAKAASAGGGVSVRRGSQSLNYNLTIVGICLAGLALIIGSVIGRTISESVPFVGAPAQDTPVISAKWRAAQQQYLKISKDPKADPKKLKAALDNLNKFIAGSHIHAAYGVYNCDAYEAPFNASTLPDPQGIHAHDDGLIHTHPVTKGAGGRRAQLSRFFSATNMRVNSNEIKWIADTTGTKFRTLNVKKDKCTIHDPKDPKNKKKDKKVDAEISMLYWETSKSNPVIYTGGFSDIRITADSSYAFVFAPKGKKNIPIPPSSQALAAPTDLSAEQAAASGKTTTTTTAAPGAVTTVVATPSTKVGETATTKVGAPTTTPATTAAPKTTTATTAAPATTAAVTTAPATTKKP
jgi:hypothetical protein